jgi:hypothetical protein
MTRGMGSESSTNISQHLKGIGFPASKDDLIQKAKENHAGSDVLGKIKAMPNNEFRTMADVMKDFGQESQTKH